MKKSIVWDLVTGMATVLALIGAPSSSEAQSFVDVSASAGIIWDSLNKSWSSPVWGDINNDGNLDVLVSVHGVTGTNRPLSLCRLKQTAICTLRLQTRRTPSRESSSVKYLQTRNGVRFGQLSFVGREPDSFCTFARRENLRSNETPIITVIGNAFWDFGHAPRDQSKRRKGLPQFAVWEIHPIMALHVVH